MNGCVFCKIIAGEIPTNKVYEDDSFFVLLDIHPINPGHLLIVPKKHIPYVFDMQDPLFTELFKLARTLAPKIKEVMKVVRVGLAIEGFGVDHTHVHLVPINTINELNPERAKAASPEELKEVAEKIRATLSKE